MTCPPRASCSSICTKLFRSTRAVRVLISLSNGVTPKVPGSESIASASSCSRESVMLFLLEVECTACCMFRDTACRVCPRHRQHDRPAQDTPATRQQWGGSAVPRLVLRHRPGCASCRPTTPRRHRPTAKFLRLRSGVGVLMHGTYATGPSHLGDLLQRQNGTEPATALSTGASGWPLTRSGATAFASRAALSRDLRHLVRGSTFATSGV